MNKYEAYFQVIYTLGDLSFSPHYCITFNIKLYAGFALTSEIICMHQSQQERQGLTFLIY